MRIGMIVTALVMLSALCVVMYVFASNSSPYVTVEQALKSPGNYVHIAGSIDKPSLRSDAKNRLVTFTLIDEHGARIPVRYNDAPPANMGEAKQLVASGTIKGSTFEADKLLLKCPSKYEAKAKE